MNNRLGITAEKPSKDVDLKCRQKANLAAGDAYVWQLLCNARLGSCLRLCDTKVWLGGGRASSIKWSASIHFEIGGWQSF